MVNHIASEEDHLAIDIIHYGTLTPIPEPPLKKLIETTNDFIIHIMSFLSSKELSTLYATSRGFQTIVSHYQRPWYLERNRYINTSRLKDWENNHKQYQAQIAIEIRKERTDNVTCSFMVGALIPLVLAGLGWLNYLYPYNEETISKKIFLSFSIACSIVTVLLCIAPFVINIVKLVNNEKRKNKILKDKPEKLLNLSEQESQQKITSSYGRFFNFKSLSEPEQKKSFTCTIL